MWQTDLPTDRGIMWGLELRSMWLKFGKANQSFSVPMVTRAFKSSKFSTWNTICLPDLVIRDKLGTTSTWGLAGNTLSLSIMYLLSSQSCQSDMLFGTSSENFLNILTSRFSFVGKPKNCSFFVSHFSNQQVDSQPYSMSWSTWQRAHELTHFFLSCLFEFFQKVQNICLGRQAGYEPGVAF